MTAPLDKYADLWTTDLQRYALVELSDEQGGGCLVFDVEAWAPVAIDDESDVLDEVYENMRRAGVRIMKSAEISKPR